MTGFGSVYPANLDVAYVRGQFVDLGGNAMKGSVTLTPNFNPVLLDPALQLIIGKKAFTQTLDNQGKVAIAVPVTDDPDVNPSGWTYTVTEPTGRTYDIAVPISTPLLDSPGDPLNGFRVINLITVMPSPTSGGTVQLLGTAPDATTTVKGKAVLLGGTADNPTVPWSKITGAPAGGVSSVNGRTGTVTGLAERDAVPVVLNVKAYGAVGDGATDDSAAFTAAYQAAVAAAGSSWSIPGELMGRAHIYVPPGRYKVTQPGALMAGGQPPSLTMGITYSGAGVGVSEILFQPSTGPGSYLMTNTAWKGLTVRDLTFLCGTTDASFMSSQWVPGRAVQDYRFERCMWDGNWQYGLRLSGQNNNDCFVWDQCSIHGRWSAAFLQTGDAALADTTQDQFLIYAFRDCKIEMQSGQFCVMPWGGNLNVTGGSLIFSDAAAAGTFFTMPDVGMSHYDGCQRFLLQGARVELHALNHKLIDCHWRDGVVHIDNITDTAYNSILPGIASMEAASFASHNSGGPVVLWTNCDLVGRHAYRWGINDFKHRPMARYVACVLRSWSEPAQFILTEGAAGAEGNTGGAAAVEFEGCRGGGASEPWLYPPDQTVNWQQSGMGTPKRRAFSVKGPYSNLPYDGEPTLDCWLPTGAMITGVRFYKPAGGGTVATNWSYTLTTSETTPTTLATISGGGTTPWWQTWTQTTAVNNFVCDSDARRHLVLTAANAPNTSGLSLCVIEYYG